MKSNTVLEYAEEMVNLGVDVKLTLGAYGLVEAQFIDGFYKSDGMTRLEQRGNSVRLSTRYDNEVEVNSVVDIVKASKEWYEFSKDRFAGWSKPAIAWAPLYDTLLKDVE